MTPVLKEVFLDLNNPDFLIKNPDQVGEEFLMKFNVNKKLIGERYSKVHQPRILDGSRSVELFQQSKSLFCLGLFESSIMVSRSTAEYIASELLRENLTIIENEDGLKNFIVDSIDFRKIVNDFLYGKVIDKKVRKNFNDLYTLGNNYVHPKSESLNAEQDALKAILLLDELICCLRNILNKYDIKNGVLVVKT